MTAIEPAIAVITKLTVLGFIYACASIG